MPEETLLGEPSDAPAAVERFPVAAKVYVAGNRPRNTMLRNEKNAAALSPPPLLLSLTCEETGDQDDRDGQEPLQRSRKVRDIDEVALGHGASGRSRGHSRRKKEVVGGVLRVGGRKGFCETRDGDGGDGAKEDEQKKKKKDGLFALALSDKPSLFLFLFTPLSRQTRAATARRREREKKRYGKKMSERRKERDRCPPF